MNNGQVILPIACCVSLLSGCAYFQPASNMTGLIKPTMVTRHSTESAEAMYQLGRYYQGQERYEQAITAYKKALVADNNYADANNGLGVVYWLQGKSADSLDQFKYAVKKSPGAARFYNNLGYAYYMQGRYVESLTVLKESLALEPGNKRTRENLNMAYAKAGGKTESSVVLIPDNKLQSVPPSKDGNKTLSAGTLIADAAAAKINNVASKQITILTESDNKHSEVQELVVPLVDNEIIAVQTASNIYEIRERPKTVPALTSVAEYKSATEPSFGLTPKAQILVEVSNGNGVNGMAKKVGQYLSSKGYAASKISNQKSFQVKQTQIQYRDGYLDQARALQIQLPNKPELVKSNHIRADVAVKLVLGKDLVGRLAFHDDKTGSVKLAMSYFEH